MAYKRNMVPQIKKMNIDELAAFIADVGQVREDGDIVLMNTSFRMGAYENINPLFIWKLTSSVFDTIPVEKISA